VQRDRPLESADALLLSLSLEDTAASSHARLVRKWKPEGVKASSDLTVEVEVEEASFNSVFRATTARHIDLITRALYEQIVTSEQFSKDQVKPQMDENLTTGLSVKIYTDLHILIKVSTSTGRLEFAFEGGETEPSVESRIVKAAQLANESRDTLVDTLLRMRASVRYDHLYLLALKSALDHRGLPGQQGLVSGSSMLSAASLAHSRLCALRPRSIPFSRSPCGLSKLLLRGRHCRDQLSICRHFDGVGSREQSILPGSQRDWLYSSREAWDASSVPRTYHRFASEALRLQPVRSLD
jgi:hypothetical protein